LYPLQGGRSTDLSQSTDLPARDTTYTHTHDMLLHHRNI